MGQTATGFVESERYDGYLGFWNNGPVPVLCISTTDSLWNVDSIDVGETIAMSEGENLPIFNCSNVHINTGIRFMRTDTISWNISYSNSVDRFVLRARFTEDDTPPVSYDATYDYIKDVISWSTPILFGGQGWDIGLTESRNLWLQFIAPQLSTTYGPNTIVIEIAGTIFLP